MKAKDLIKLLEKLPPTQEIYLSDDEWGSYYPITEYDEFWVSSQGNRLYESAAKRQKGAHKVVLLY